MKVISIVKNPVLDIPNVKYPCLAKPDIKVYYSESLILQKEVYCDKTFSDIVLTEFNDNKVDIIHRGIYNPRLARDSKGVELVPKRWSNHAYGTSIDFLGFYINERIIVDYNNVKFHIILRNIQKRCDVLGLKTEFVNENAWFHIGFFGNI